MSTEFYVSYKVPLVSGDKEHLAGPYPTAVEAKINAMDISGYQGVTELRVYSENPDELMDNLLDGKEANS